jgi:tetratricopeptide (TPR) repeat protein
MSERPRLSICMIVRDEADMLPALLDGVDGLWDELCVVDTGSTDGTVELLERAGAVVAHMPWRDDFAAARNASLDLAGGEWILFLDADERVSPELAASIRDLLDDAVAGAATVLLQDELPHGHRRRSRLLRLFRRDPSIRFTHAIHEDPTAAVGAYLARTGRRLRQLDGTLHHLGYVRDVAAARDKRRRDLRLLESCVAENPRDWYSRYKILEQARFWDDREAWRAAATDTARAVEEADDDLAAFPFVGELAVLTAQGLHEDPVRELSWLDGWRERADGSPEYRLRRGLLLELAGRVDEAAVEFAACLELPPTHLVQNVTVRPLMGLSRLSAIAGDVTGALAHAERALDHNARDPEALLAAVSFAHAVGELPAFLARHRQRRGESIELAQALLFCGEVDAARKSSLRLRDRLPEAGLGVLVCDLIEGRDSDLEIELDQDAADAALARWLTALEHARREDLMLAFARNAPAVAEVFPWLPVWLESRLPVPDAR